MPARVPHISAAEAATRLGVRLPTLYSYVSRGLICSRRGETGDPRTRSYAAADVEALLKRRERAKRPAIAAATALDWGLPVLETRLTAIEGGRLIYRGRDAVAFAAAATIEDAAALLWETTT